MQTYWMVTDSVFYWFMWSNHSHFYLQKKCPSSCFRQLHNRMIRSRIWFSSRSDHQFWCTRIRLDWRLAKCGSWDCRDTLTHFSQPALAWCKWPLREQSILVRGFLQFRKKINELFCLLITKGWKYREQGLWCFFELLLLVSVVLRLNIFWV